MKSQFFLFYGLIGLASSLALFVIFYWSLRLNSSISSLIQNTISEPLYFWPYVMLTFGTIILFGIDVSLIAYKWRKFGPPRFKTHAGGSLGAVVGMVASACPVCGSILLSAIGLTGGLAVFPLGGLELKALSFGLMALPLWFMTKESKKLNAAGACPLPREATLAEKDRIWLTRLIILVIFFVFVSFSMLASDPAMARRTIPIEQKNNNLYHETVERVIPKSGFQSKIKLGNSILGLVENGVIDKEKFEGIYKGRGGLQEKLKEVLIKPSNQPILLTRENAFIYVNLLWPLGLSNYLPINRQSPLIGSSLFNFASTGGWNLGKEENGGAYFNKFSIVRLTPSEEALVGKIAKNTYRPCCDNSTFFQDCNHGSALLGLLTLGASQGLTEEELYREALMFNSFWFANNYIQTALYFKVVKHIDWEKIDPKVILGYNYSAASGWIRNVQSEVAKIPNLFPKAPGGGGCGI